MVPRMEAAADRASHHGYGLCNCTIDGNRISPCLQQDHTTVYIQMSGLLWIGQIPALPRYQNCHELCH